MKRCNLIVLICLITQLAFGQNKTISRDELLFEKGILLHELATSDLRLDAIIESNDSEESEKDLAAIIKETLLEKALEHYQELTDSFPTSALLFRTLGNKGFIQLALEDREAARETFQQILDSKANDKEKGGTGSGLMMEPYANYKNTAAKVLAKLNLEDSNYTEALRYLDLTKQYPYLHFCGNAYAAETIHMSGLYAKCYLGLKDTAEALKILLPHIVENGLADNTDLVHLAYQTLLKKYSKDELKRRYIQAFKNCRTEKVKSKEYEYKRYFITFLDTKIELDSWSLGYTEPNEQAKIIEELCKNSLFYNLLNE